MKADPKTEQEIVGVLNEFDRAFREQDVEGVMKLFHDRPVFVGSESGAEARGIQETRSFFEGLFSEPIAYGFHWEKVDIEVVGEMVWLFSDCHIETISAAGRHQHPYRVTAVLQRIEGQWRLVHYHGSEPAG